MLPVMPARRRSAPACPVVPGIPVVGLRTGGFFLCFECVCHLRTQQAARGTRYLSKAYVTCTTSMSPKRLDRARYLSAEPDNHLLREATADPFTTEPRTS